MKNTTLVIVLISLSYFNLFGQCPENDPCPGIGNWDTRNCHIMKAPQNSTAFIYQNNLYVSSPNGQASGCPSGTSWDGANCFVATIPPDRFGFVYDNSLYLEPACDLIGPPKRLTITDVKINIRKDVFWRDDLSFAAILYDNNNCSITQPLTRIKFKKIKKNDIGTWQTITYTDITGPNLFLLPNQTIAFVLFDHDGSGSKSWNYNLHCNGTIYYQSKQSAYGMLYLKYHYFLGNSFKKQFDTDGFSIKIEVTNQ